MVYLQRIIDTLVKEYLEIFGAVYIRGPKWCGKTTTAERHAKSILKLQDPRKSSEYLKLAEIHPSVLLQGEKPRLIDEWQLAPTLWDAVRTTIDEEQQAGLFLLTGSSVPASEPTRHSGTGRISRLQLRPMSLYESQESSGAVSLSDLFSGSINIDGLESHLTIEHIAQAICRGGWPATIGKSEHSSLIIARDYVESLCESDISRIDGIERNPVRARALLRSYARNICTLTTNTQILRDLQANDVSLSETTLYAYLNALERLFIFEDVPAWCPAIRSRTAIRSTNKKCFTDPSIAAAALRIAPESLLKDLQTFGFLFEALVIRDLRVYVQKLGGDVCYYHDRYNLECDAVVRLHDERFALCEIKLGGSEIDNGASHLLQLNSLLKEHHMRVPELLMVITGGKLAYTRPDGVHVVPIGCLKD